MSSHPASSTRAWALRLPTRIPARPWDHRAVLRVFLSERVRDRPGRFQPPCPAEIVGCCGVVRWRPRLQESNPGRWHGRR
ncbi:uncharacterized protein LOC143673834 isoform X2 [Tamandua tetradactyla]|uniref:uncharacterized protein LOC143673834 isoform X2 n=1 Tax=Tamandua tetradactyla TaxID=48850 RepID=UPI0040549537